MKKVFLSAVITIATMWANVAYAQGGVSPQQVQQKPLKPLVLPEWKQNHQ